VRIASLDALTRPVVRDAVAAMKASVTPTVNRRIRKQTTDAVGSTFVMVLVFLVAAGCFAGMPFLFAFTLPIEVGLVKGGIGVGILVVVSATVGRWAFRRVQRVWAKVGTWTHRWRMQQHALENRLNYIPTSGDLQLTGTVLANAGRGHWDTFRILGDRFGMFGNVLPFGSGGEDRAPYGWGFLAVRLDAHVPHMLLIPRDKMFTLRGALFNLAGSQRMSLEGDFDKHFQLYAPVAYNRDALYVITPDLMALLIDQLPGSYVETFDDTLVVTTPEPYDFSTPAAWDKINLLLETVVPKAMRQTRNYRDPTSPVRGRVATAGSRLRFAFPVLAVGLAGWFNLLLVLGLLHALGLRF
jgi:hypothetical protein